MDTSGSPSRRRKTGPDLQAAVPPTQPGPVGLMANPAMPQPPGEIGFDPRNPWAIPNLMSLLSDPNPLVRSEAIHALGLIKPPMEAPMIPTGRMEGESNAGAPKPLTPKTSMNPSGFARPSLSGGDVRARTIAGTGPGIGHFSDVIAPALMTRLSDTDPQVRMNAAEALGRLGDESALPLLRRLMETEKNKTVRASAEKAIAALEDNED